MVGCGFVKLVGVIAGGGLLWVVVGFIYWCGACHGGLAASGLVFGGLGVVVL